MEAGRTRDAVEEPSREDRLLHTLFDRVPAMVAYWDRDLRNVVANEAYVEWFGFTPEEMRGIHIREVLGETVYAMNLPFLRGALAGEEQLFDRTLVDTHGRTRHTQASYVPDVVDGQVRGIFVLVTDVTPRVEAQRAMNEAQALARIGSWEMVLESGEITFSDELYRIFGYEPGDVVPTLAMVRERVHPDDRARVEAVRERAIRDGGAYAVDYRLSHPDGAVIEVHSLGSPVRDSSGAVVRLTGTIQDVTEVTAMARELARVNEELVQLNELNADVIGMLGHDVRGPLTVVFGYLEDLDVEWETMTDSIRRSHIATARAAAGRLRTLVDDILALASLDTGTVEPQASDHDLRLLVAEAISEVPGQSEIRVEGADDLRVWCDAFHVRQVVANLASNALRYGGPQ